VAADNK